VTTIHIKASDGIDVAAYVAHPKGKAKGAIVLVQEIFGVNAHIREVADGFARDGYLVVAPATFHRIKHGVQLGYDAQAMEEGRHFKAAVEALPAPGVMADLQAAIDYAAEHSGANVGMVGYCWGGLLTWRAAAQLKGLSAAVSYYGGGTTSSEEMQRQPLCPVLAHFATQDHWIPLDSVEKFKLKHPEVLLYLYDADHGFNCDHRGAYQQEAATLARERTLAFFTLFLA
jgi:carboxymethylenebutenolidase